jgi:hypothetical protein
MIAGVFPTPRKGMKKARTARLGSVCMMFAIPIIIEALLFIRVNIIPSGTATIIPRKTAIMDIYKCSHAL